MATQAKVVLGFEHAAWRDGQRSGNAFVQREGAVLDEVFDACDGTAQVAALGAFIALSPDERGAVRRELPALISAQASQIFGSALSETEQSYRDWAMEPYTCSLRDRREHRSHPERACYGAPELRQAYWDQRLFFGGSETSEIEGGYTEGALQAAERIAHELSSHDTAPIRPVSASHCETLDECSPNPIGTQAASLVA
jgi:monoamine oxidase